MIEIVSRRVEPETLRQICDQYFKTFVKIVVDIEQGIVALGGELHADAEALLLNQGSKQSNLWGANYYPFKRYQERLEYTALINIRPRDNNFTMEIESSDIRKKIVEITTKLLLDKNDTLA